MASRFGSNRTFGFKVRRVSDRDEKAEALDEIIAFLWPERMDPPPEDHGWWSPGDGPYEWSSDMLQVIFDLLHARGLV